MLELYFPQMIVIIRWCTPQVNIFKPSIQIQPPNFLQFCILQVNQGKNMHTFYQLGKNMHSLHPHLAVFFPSQRGGGESKSNIHPCIQHKLHLA